MILVDSHAHLFYEEVYANLAGKLETARRAGVKYILTVCTSSKSMHLNLAIAEQHEGICCSVGIHPTSLKGGYDAKEMIELSKNKKVVAVGEIGLDYHYQDEVPKDIQLHGLDEMLGIASQCELPCIIHARECFDDIFDVMENYPIKPSVFHCYTGTMENAKKILNLGHYVSFSGIVTFNKAAELREVAQYVPDDKILVETDCPYLAPVPHRGKPNEPALVKVVAEYIANLRGVAVEELAEKTYQNFFTVFPKAKFLNGGK
ncbi:MAG: TatD family hydrolase [Holosporales bacterium]|jgi:TatD DNase family protein|nr:TatD family hydrolase [Holosporales bacterium]